MLLLEASPLQIDCDRVVGAIKEQIQSLLQRDSREAVLMGISGGIDSALLAALSVEAVGRRRVKALFIYDRYYQDKPLTMIRLLAKKLGFSYKLVRIDKQLKDLNAYSTPLVKMENVSGEINKLAYQLSHKIRGESYYLSRLRTPKVRKNKIGIPGFRAVKAHILRRLILEKKAERENLLLLGAANRTESMIGWFVKNGVDDLPIQPLSGLYKTQIRQLAAHMGVPREVIDQPPSPDIMKGITDEMAIGLCYAKIDLVLDYLEGGITIEDLIKNNVTPKEMRDIKGIKRLSAWKRGKNKEIPVDGGPRGGFRTLNPKGTSSISEYLYTT
jgi:NAD+ synthase